MDSNIVFQEYGIIDVTNFDATPENPELGYLCGGIVTVLSDGEIVSHNANEGGELLEDFLASDLISVNSNINDFDPECMTEISLMTQDKNIRISFGDTEKKQSFVETLKNLDI